MKKALVALLLLGSASVQAADFCEVPDVNNVYGDKQLINMDAVVQVIQGGSEINVVVRPNFSPLRLTMTYEEFKNLCIPTDSGGKGGGNK